MTNIVTILSRTTAMHRKHGEGVTVLGLLGLSDSFQIEKREQSDCSIVKLEGHTLELSDYIQCKASQLLTKVRLDFLYRLFLIR